MLDDAAGEVGGRGVVSCTVDQKVSPNRILLKRFFGEI